MSREVVAYLTIRGPERVAALADDAPDPTPAELAAYAEPLTVRNGGVAPVVVVRTSPRRPSPSRTLVATTWDGSKVLRRLGMDEPDPSPAALSAAGRANVRGGVAAVIRVVEAMPSLRSWGVGGTSGAAGSIEG